MEYISVEHEQIAKLWNGILIFPKLHSETREWLSSSRHKQVHLYPFPKIKEILQKAFTNVEVILKIKELLELCQFNLNEEYVKNINAKISKYQRNIGFSNYSDLEKLIEISNENIEIIEKFMSETYVLKDFMELNNIIKDEYFDETINKNIKAIKFLLLEVKYNLLKLNVENRLLQKNNEAIRCLEGLLENKIWLIETSNRKKNLELIDFHKYLSIEDNLRQIIFEFKKELNNGNNIIR